MRRTSLLLLPLFGVFVAALKLLPTAEGWAGDEGVYLGLARNLTHGHYRDASAGGALNMCFPGWQTPDLWYGPGFPALLAPLVGLGLPVSVVRLVGPVLLFVAVLLFYRLLLLSVRPRSAFVGALGLGLFLPFYRYLPFLHSEFLALVLVIIAMLGITQIVRSGSRVGGLIAALALAWLALTRVAYGWVLAVLLLAWLVRWLVSRSASSRRLLVVHAVALAFCIPWLAYTHSVTGRPFLWSTSGSLSLYWMSSPYAADRGDWHCASDVFQVSWLAPHRRFFSAHAQDSPTAQDRALERQAIRNAVHHPAKYAQNVAENAGRIFFDFPYSRRPLTVRDFAVFVVPGALLLLLLALSLTRMAAVGVRLPPEGAAFVLYAVVAFAVSLPASAYVRMIIPIVPPLLWLIVYGLDRAPLAAIRRLRPRLRV